MSQVTKAMIGQNFVSYLHYDKICTAAYSGYNQTSPNERHQTRTFDFSVVKFSILQEVL